MKQLALLLVMALAFINVNAQSTKGIYLSVNPFAVLEPQAAYGMAVGYTFNENFDVSTEYSRLSKPNWGDAGSYINIKGFRSITTLKFTTSTDEWRRSRNFIAAEFRIRKFSFDDVQDFTDVASHNTIRDYWFKNNTTVKGLAVLAGKQKDMCENGKWVLEFTAGIGVKQTTVNRENTPANMTIVPVEAALGEIPNYRNEQTSVYFPLALRVIMKF